MVVVDKDSKRVQRHYRSESREVKGSDKYKIRACWWGSLWYLVTPTGLSEYLKKIKFNK